MNNYVSRLLVIMTLLALALAMSACGFEESCDNTQAQMVTISSSNGDFRIDAYEASRSNATAQTTGTGVTLACNYRGAIPWGNVSYADAKNACLDAGKRLCTETEWMAACGAANAYPYGDTYQKDTCNMSGVAATTGAKSSCKSAKGVYDMSGNLHEWVEGGKLMGGSYFSQNGDELSCSSVKSVPDALSFVPSEDVGFRCCQDVSTL